MMTKEEARARKAALLDEVIEEMERFNEVMATEGREIRAGYEYTEGYLADNPHSETRPFSFVCNMTNGRVRCEWEMSEMTQEAMRHALRCNVRRLENMDRALGMAEAKSHG